MDFRLELAVRKTVDIEADTIEEAMAKAKNEKSSQMDWNEDGVALYEGDWSYGGILYADDLQGETVDEPYVDGYEQEEQGNEDSEIPFWMI